MQKTHWPNVVNKPLLPRPCFKPYNDFLRHHTQSGRCPSRNLLGSYMYTVSFKLPCKKVFLTSSLWIYHDLARAKLRVSRIVVGVILDYVSTQSTIICWQLPSLTRQALYRANDPSELVLWQKIHIHRIILTPRRTGHQFPSIIFNKSRKFINRGFSIWAYQGLFGIFRKWRRIIRLRKVTRIFGLKKCHAGLV